MIQLSSLSGVPLYRQIVAQVKQMAAAGKINPGDRLPSVRQLAGQLNVNTLTVAKAYARLAAEGIVQTRRCKGVFVAGGGSPLSFSARRRKLAQAADQFIAEAYRLDVAAGEAVDLLRERFAEHQPFTPGSGHATPETSAPATGPSTSIQSQDEEDISVL